MTDEPASARRNLAGDAWGGLAAMLVALPSAIAFGATIFAPLGGASAAQGALAGILGTMALGLVAPLFGGTSRLVTAPCAPAAAVLAALAAGFVQQEVPVESIPLLLALIGLLAGGLQIALGLSGVGRLIKYLPYPVVSGYLSAVGLIIIGSQIPKLLGTAPGTSLATTLFTPAAWQWQAVTVGGAVIAAMLLTPRLTEKIPAAIIALLAGITTYQLLGLADPQLLRTAGNPLLIGPLAGDDDSLTDAIGRHVQALQGLGVGIVLQVLVPAVTLALLLSIDTLKTCVVIDAITRGRHDSNRELFGQGLGNVASALVGGIPGAGTMGATLINIGSGAKTRTSGFLAGAYSLVAFLALAPLVAWVPIPALAAILIVIGLRMIDRHSLSFFFSPATRLDFAVIVAVVLVALFGNLIAASGVGIALSILLFIREQTRSSIVRNRIEGHDIFSKRTRTRQNADLLQRSFSDTVVFELQGALFFGTASQLKTALEAEVATRKYVILSMRRVQSLDVTATHVLEQFKDRLEENDGSLIFCDIPKGLPSGLKMKRFLKATGVIQPTNKAFAFSTLDDALSWVEALELEDTDLADADSIACELRDFPMFAGCSEQALAALEGAVESRHVVVGKRVFKAADDSNNLFLIRRGSVRLTVPLRKKETYHLATCGPGELIGAMGFIEAGSHAVDALALTDCEVYELERERFEVLAVEHSDLAIAIFGTIAHTLSMRLRVAIGELQALRG